jgi:hypothetical protein
VPQTLIGQAISCGQCGRSIPCTAPPPISGTEPETNAESTEEVVATSSLTLLAYVLLTLFISFGIGAIGVVIIASLVLKTSWPARNIFQFRDAVPNNQDSTLLTNPERWTDASKKSISYAGAMVTIDRVVWSPVRFQAAGENRITDDNYLLVNLTVHNQSRPELLYKSWYSYHFEGEDEPIMAKCQDIEETEFLLFPIPEADRVEAHFRSEAHINVKDSVTDSILFKLPPDYVLPADAGLKLSLPAEALGDEGFYRFDIPYTMIETDSPL